jgi:hypothetical protein
MIETAIICMSSEYQGFLSKINIKNCNILIITREAFETNADNPFASMLTSKTRRCPVQNTTDRQCRLVLLLAVAKIAEFKKMNPSLKVLLSLLGPWELQHYDLLRNVNSRTDFNQRITQYLIDNNLNGFGKMQRFN